MRFESMLAMLLLLAANVAQGQSTSFDEASQKARINVQLAESYLQAGDLAAALDKANRAVRRDEKSPEAHAVLAMVFDRMNRQEKAKASFERAEKLAPETGAVLNAIAVWHCQHRRYPEAETYFNKALDDPLSKQHLQFHRNGGECAYLAQNLAAAERHYRQILEIRATDTAALEALAMIHLGKGDALRARAFIQRREAAGPATDAMLDLAARIEDLAGARDAAAEYRRRRQEQFPDSAPTAPEGTSQP